MYLVEPVDFISSQNNAAARLHNLSSQRHVYIKDRCLQSHWISLVKAHYEKMRLQLSFRELNAFYVEEDNSNPFAGPLFMSFYGDLFDLYALKKRNRSCFEAVYRSVIAQLAHAVTFDLIEDDRIYSPVQKILIHIAGL